MKSFPYYQQLDSMDCEATCLRMVTKHYGKSYTFNTLRKRSYITPEGVCVVFGMSSLLQCSAIWTRQAY